MCGLRAHAVNQQWLSFQAERQLSADHSLLINYQRRDVGDLFQRRLLNVYRFHLTKNIGDWRIIFGGAYFDQESGTSERRLHQYVVKKVRLLGETLGFFRLGLEERHFNSDHFLYLRLRARALVRFLNQKPIGPVLYNETFYIPKAQTRFSSALNENRSGIGLRYSLPSARFLLFHAYTYSKLPTETRHEQWWQFYINFSF